MIDTSRAIGRILFQFKSGSPSLLRISVPRNRLQILNGSEIRQFAALDDLNRLLHVGGEAVEFQHPTLRFKYQRHLGSQVWNFEAQAAIFDLFVCKLFR